MPTSTLFAGRPDVVGTKVTCTDRDFEAHLGARPQVLSSRFIVFISFRWTPIVPHLTLDLPVRVSGGKVSHRVGPNGRTSPLLRASCVCNRSELRPRPRPNGPAPTPVSPDVSRPGPWTECAHPPGPTAAILSQDQWQSTPNGATAIAAPPLQLHSDHRP